jgi:hypothetical protein
MYYVGSRNAALTCYTWPQTRDSKKKEIFAAYAAPDVLHISTGRSSSSPTSPHPFPLPGAGAPPPPPSPRDGAPPCPLPKLVADLHFFRSRLGIITGCRLGYGHRGRPSQRAAMVTPRAATAAVSVCFLRRRRARRRGALGRAEAAVESAISQTTSMSREEEARRGEDSTRTLSTSPCHRRRARGGGAMRGGLHKATVDSATPPLPSLRRDAAVDSATPPPTSATRRLPPLARTETSPTTSTKRESPPKSASRGTMPPHNDHQGRSRSLPSTQQGNRAPATEHMDTRRPPLRSTRIALPSHTVATAPRLARL